MSEGIRFIVTPTRHLSLLTLIKKSRNVTNPREISYWSRPKSLSALSTHKYPKFKSNLIKFNQLSPKQNANKDSELLKSSLRSFLVSIDIRKFISFGQGNPKGRKVPRLILIQNPFTWLMAKINFKVLRRFWDPHFTEDEFKFGTRQAISKVTQVISAGKYEELNGLLTRPARVSLIRDLDRNFNKVRRTALALQNEDIQISSPRKVHFIRIEDKKYCDVDMCFMALKWIPIVNSKEALLFADIFARFHREYTPHSIPEWTIAYFKVKRLQLVRSRETS